MNRRGFFQSLAALGAVSVVQVPASGTSGDLRSFAPNGHLKSLGDAYLRRAHDVLMGHLLGFYVPHTVSLDPWQADIQRHFGYRSDDIESALSANWMFKPGLRCLAIGSVECGLGEWTKQEIPQGLDYAGMIGPLRLCVDRDVFVEQYVTRFDVRFMASRPACEIDPSRRRFSASGTALQVVGYPINPSNRWELQT